MTSSDARRASAALALRTARLAAGYTQAQLAEATDLHERSIRGLELGKIASPRLDTLDRIASAVGMTVSERDLFMTAWRGPQAPGIDTLDAPFGSGKVLADFLRRAIQHNKDSLFKVATMQQATVGRDRRVHRVRTSEALVARKDAVQQSYIILNPGADVDAGRIRIRGYGSLRLGEQYLCENDIKVFAIEFGSPLQKGESRVVHYECDFVDAYRSDAPLTTRVGLGFFQSRPTYSLSVTFDPKALPASVRQEFQPTSTSAPRYTKELRLDPFHATHISLQSPRAGAHLIAWSW